MKLQWQETQSIGIHKGRCNGAHAATVMSVGARWAWALYSRGLNTGTGGWAQTLDGAKRAAEEAYSANEARLVL